MPAWKFAQAMGSLSRGLGDWLNIELQKEQQRLERQWQMTLEAQREARQDQRNEARMAQERALNEQNQAAQTARHSETMAAREAEAGATASFRQSQLDQRDSEFQQSRVDDARKTLQKTLLEYDEAMRKELENPMLALDENAKQSVVERYTGLKDQAITGTVAWLSSENLPGYEVNSRDELQSLLIQNGMDLAGAKEHSGNIWGQISGTGELFPEVGDNTEPAWQPSQPPYIDGQPNQDYVNSVAARNAPPQPAPQQPPQQQPGQPPVAGAPTIAAPTVPAPGGYSSNPQGPPRMSEMLAPKLGELFDEWSRSPIWNDETRQRNYQISQDFLERQRQNQQ